MKPFWLICRAILAVVLSLCVVRFPQSTCCAVPQEVRNLPPASDRQDAADSTSGRKEVATFTRRDALRQYDVNRDGVVDVSEAAQMSDEHRRALRAEQESQLLQSLAVIRHWDANRDGILEPGEVPAASRSFVERIGRKAGAKDFSKPWRLDILGKHLRALDRATPGRSRPAANSANGIISPIASADDRNANTSAVARQYALRNTARMYAENLLQLYDGNGNGQLEEAEWSRLSPEWRRADRNGNHRLTTEEIADQFVLYQQAGAASSATGGTARRPLVATAGRADSTIRRLPEGLPDWFLERDRNRDGQIQMAEFTQAWTEAKAAEFVTHDLNGDGIITPAECLAAETKAPKQSP